MTLSFEDWYAIRPLLADVRVLLVEDDADGRELYTFLLEKHGATVTAVGSSSEALDALAAQSVDILVSDIGLPGEDGYALITKVRASKSDHERDMPALAVTAFAAPGDCEHALDAGFDAHLAKPFELDKLAGLVAMLVHRVEAVRHYSEELAARKHTQSRLLAQLEQLLEDSREARERSHLLREEGRRRRANPS